MHTFPAHGAPTTTTLIGFITGGRVTLETRVILPLSGPPSKQVLYVRSWWRTLSSLQVGEFEIGVDGSALRILTSGCLGA